LGVARAAKNPHATARLADHFDSAKEMKAPTKPMMADMKSVMPVIFEFFP
jgi:hypothetical protein